jgi:hypothetical protein
MGRKSHSRALSVWANGERVGTWVVLPGGETELHYDAHWKQSAALALAAVRHRHTALARRARP